MYSVSEVNGVKVYNMSAAKSVKEFEQDFLKTSKSLRFNQDFRKRVELIQDFSFEASCSQVELTADQRYILCTGTYAPQLKIFDTAELSLKCLRGIDSEAVRFVPLGEDYAKIAIAEMDRTIELHAQYGFHFKTRIPHCPRDMVYNPFNCNLLVSASANEVYRLTLEEGRFLQPFSTMSYINSLEYNKQLNVLFAGGQNLEVWDFRERRRIATVASTDNSEITSVKCDSTGLLVAVGQEGFVDLFDVRFDKRMSCIRHPYIEPVKCIEFEPLTKRIVSCTKRQIRLTDHNGSLFTSIEPQSDINRFSLVPGSGLVLAALEDPKIGCFFIPELGPAPRWVPYLENMTEELEETSSKVVYDEYRFVG